MNTFKRGPLKQNRRKKRWPILVGALLGALLPVLVEAGLVGLSAAHDVRQMCVGLLHLDGLHDQRIR
jgi:cobalamin synthase